MCTWEQEFNPSFSLAYHSLYIKNVLHVPYFNYSLIFLRKINILGVVYIFKMVIDIY